MSCQAGRRLVCVAQQAWQAQQQHGKHMSRAGRAAGSLQAGVCKGNKGGGRGYKKRLFHYMYRQQQCRYVGKLMAEGSGVCKSYGGVVMPGRRMAGMEGRQAWEEGW